MAGGIFISAGAAGCGVSWVRNGMRLTVLDLAGGILVTIGEFLLGMWPLGIIGALAVAHTAWYLWRRRKRRDRASGLAGYKGRAVLAALVRRLRELPAPRPVLQPVPGSAR